MDHNEIRRKILGALYDKFKKEPRKPYLSKVDIALEKGLSVEDINWNIQYLCDKGYVGQPIIHMPMRSIESGAYKITHDGIDLIEDPSEFNQMFPSAVQVNINIESIRINLEKELEKVSLPPEEKMSIIQAFDKFISHPVAAQMIASILTSMMGIK